VTTTGDVDKRFSQRIRAQEPVVGIFVETTGGALA
jgi:hypothetical protein